MVTANSRLVRLTARVDVKEMSPDDTSNTLGRMRVLKVLMEQCNELENEVIELLEKYDKE